MAWYQPHAPRLSQRRQHQEAFHPREPFAEALAWPTAKRKIGIAWGGSVWGRLPPGRDERLRVGKVVRVAMCDIRADEKKGALREAIVPDLHLFPRSPRHEPRRG